MAARRDEASRVKVLVAAVLFAAPAGATEWFVAPGGSGNGMSASTPFGTVAMGLSAAMPGDTVTLAAGTYSGAVTTVRSGTAAMPITVRAAAGAAPLLTSSGRVLTVNHAYLVFEGLTLDGQYGIDDAVRISDAGNHTVLRRCEIRHATKDCVDMGSPTGVLIEGCLIHHCLNAAGGRTDAHGIVAGAVHGLVVRDTQVHSFSGDALQLDPDRLAPGWDDVTVERCHFWLAPLPAGENGFDAGVVTGENAIDTKVRFDAGYRARLTVHDVVAHGFQSGLLGNMAAFNLKENVDAVLDRVTVYDSEIAFRTRGPAGGIGGAHVTVRNAVVYRGLTGNRYEDDIDQLAFANVTFGGGLTRAFQRASSSATVADVKNTLVLAGSLPAEAAGGTNRAVTGAVFVDAAAHDYHLAAGSSPIDMGMPVAGVVDDRDGVVRPQGSAFDIGAYEWCAGCDAGMGGGGGSGGGGASGGGAGGGGGGGTAGGGSAGGSAGGGSAGGGSAGGGGDVMTGGGCHCAGADVGPLLAFALLALARRRRR